MKILYFWLYTLALGFGVLSAVEIRLVDHIAVASTDIHLKDIATITTQNAEEAERLRELVVGDLPSVGRTRVISAFRIRSLLEKQGWNEVEIKGLQSTVSVQTRSVSAGEVSDLVEAWVRARTPELQEAQITFNELPDKWEIPAGSDVILKIDSRLKSPKGRLTLAIRAKGGGRVLTSTRVRIDVQVFQEALVVIRPLVRGERLEPHHVERRRTEVTKADGMEAMEADDLLGMLARRNITIGKILSVSDFERPKLIERGSSNKILVLNGRVRLAIAGAEALQDGCKGEQILFRNPMNPKQPVQARVLRPGLAVMRLR